MPTIAPADALLLRTVAELITADMTAAGLSVDQLAVRAGTPKVTLKRALSSGLFKIDPLARVALVLGRRPSEWFAVAEAGTR